MIALIRSIYLPSISKANKFSLMKFADFSNISAKRKLYLHYTKWVNFYPWVVRRSLLLRAVFEFSGKLQFSDTSLRSFQKYYAAHQWTMEKYTKNIVQFLYLFTNHSEVIITAQNLSPSYGSSFIRKYEHWEVKIVESRF